MTPDDPRKRDRLAELERLIAEQDEKHEERMREQTEALIEVLVDREMERLGPVSDAVARQLGLLADRLLALDLVDPDEDEIEERCWIDPDKTGEVIVGIEVNGLLYAFGGVGAGDVLIVRRKVGGHSEYAVLDENGQPIRWYLAAPPPSTAATN